MGNDVRSEVTQAKLLEFSFFVEIVYDLHRLFEWHSAIRCVEIPQLNGTVVRWLSEHKAMEGANLYLLNVKGFERCLKVFS